MPADIAHLFANSLSGMPKRALPSTALQVPIAFHIITDGKNGKVTNQQLATLINNLNWAFRETPISFFLARVDTTKNKSWYANCLSNSKNQKAMKKRLARDTRYYLNIYSCKPYVAGNDVLGQATFPFLYPNGNYMHGVLVHPAALPGGSADFPYGLVAAHEIGHYFGLFHTFESAFNSSGDVCGEPGDFIADTPTQAEPHHSCPSGIDTCSGFPGLDDVPNFMNYSTDDCMEHFTPGQVEVMLSAIARYRPDLGH